MTLDIRLPDIDDHGFSLEASLPPMQAEKAQPSKKNVTSRAKMPLPFQRDAMFLQYICEVDIGEMSGGKMPTN